LLLVRATAGVSWGPVRAYHWRCRRVLHDGSFRGSARSIRSTGAGAATLRLATRTPVVHLTSPV